MPPGDKIFDLAIIGGGINGCGIARDAAGRGLKVFLCERDDIGGATSSASTKLIHGGLRYLEHYDFKLVRESLIERERLWAIAHSFLSPSYPATVVMELPLRQAHDSELDNEQVQADIPCGRRKDIRAVALRK